MANHYFDFHVHPSMKSYLSSEVEAKRPNSWEVFKTIISITSSQGSLTQLWEGGINIAVCCIYVMERPMTSSFLISHVATKLKPLSKHMLHFPAYSNSFDRLNQQIDHFKKSFKESEESGKSYQFIKSINEAHENKINVILAIEGAHALENFNSTVQENLIKLKSKDLDYRFLYLTMTHISQFPVCTHAYGMKLIKNNDEFKPKGQGLTDLGKELIDIAYDETKGHRIFIDIKHMSAYSRQQFYEYRAEKGYTNIPILGTHMGVAGMERPNDLLDHVQVKNNKLRITRERGFALVCYDRPEGLADTHFNPWTINLFDYEIKIILASDGLIGLNLDQRIMGTKKVQGEYFDQEEFLKLIGARSDDSPFDNADEELEFIEEMGTEGREYKDRPNQLKHLRHFCNNILRIVSLCPKEDGTAWSQICVGSDFDGLIDPIDVCCGSEEFPKLEQKMPQCFLDIFKMEAKKGNEGDIPENYYIKSSIDDEAAFLKEMEEKTRAIMLDNAKTWLAKYYG